MKKKVLIVLNSLRIGGAEKSSIDLTVLFENLGFEVQFLVLNKKNEYSYTGIIKFFDCLLCKNKFVKWVFFYVQVKRMLHKEKFNSIIDTRTRISLAKEKIVNNLFRNQKNIFIVHSNNLDLYFPKDKDFVIRQYNNADIVCVSDGIAKTVRDRYGFQKVHTIYNYFDQRDIEKQAVQALETVPDKYIVWVGRMVEDVKNIRFLIESYLASVLAENNIKLLLVGDGPDKAMLVNKYDNPNVIFVGRKENPYPYLKQALFSCLTSHFEGFPRVVVESLICGTPVVSIDIETGPREIVQDGINGLLISGYKQQDYMQALNSMIEEPGLLEKCTVNTSLGLEKFSKQLLMEQWQTILD